MDLFHDRQFSWVTVDGKLWSSNDSKTTDYLEGKTTNYVFGEQFSISAIHTFDEFHCVILILIVFDSRGCPKIISLFPIARVRYTSVDELFRTEGLSNIKT